MKRLFQNKKPVIILSIVLAVVLASGTGLTLSGEGKDINVWVEGVDVTLKDLTLTYAGDYYECISAFGKVHLTVDGTVAINSSTNAIRGDSDDSGESSLTLTGRNNGKLIIDATEIGIASYVPLKIDSLTVELAVAPHPEYAVAYAIQSAEAATLTDSDITVKSGQFWAGKLNLENSNVSFTSTTFGSTTSGLYINNYGFESEETLISMTNSQISFTHDIAIGIGVVIIDAETWEEKGAYFINSSRDDSSVKSTYPSLDAFLADVAANGYDRMIVTDGSSRIE